jgi:CRP/FNR family cyclic AMP-dependent transcriptional regulator
MKNVTKFWFLKDFNLFKKMGKKNLMEMCHLLEMINVKKGETLSLNKEDKKVVYFIKRGSIKIVTNEHKHTRSILQMGNIFGELALYEDGGNHENEEKAVVLEDGVVCLIEAEQMKMMMENHSSIKNQRNLKDLLYKDSETRIKEFVLNYIKEFGLKKEGVLKAKNLLSHQDIAQLTNTSRQTVSNVLSKLRREGVIDYNSKEIFIATMKLKLN